MEPTQDRHCWIVERRDDGIVYQAEDGDKWIIRGECNRCGACLWETPEGDSLDWVGPVGEPGAFNDPLKRFRLDWPVRPRIKEIFPTCSLSGEYLERGDGSQP